MQQSLNLFRPSGKRRATPTLTNPLAAPQRSPHGQESARKRSQDDKHSCVWGVDVYYEYRKQPSCPLTPETPNPKLHAPNRALRPPAKPLNHNPWTLDPNPENPRTMNPNPLTPEPAAPRP